MAFLGSPVQGLRPPIGLPGPVPMGANPGAPHSNFLQVNQPTMVPRGIGNDENVVPQFHPSQPSLLHLLMAAAAAHPQQGAGLRRRVEAFGNGAMPAETHQYPQFRGMAPGLAHAAGM